jgi:hypothetical protein
MVSLVSLVSLVPLVPLDPLIPLIPFQGQLWALGCWPEGSWDGPQKP